MSADGAPTTTRANHRPKLAKSWAIEENVKLLLLVMQEENHDLSVRGWKAIGEKAQGVFDCKYSGPAVKQQFQKLRKQFLAEYGDKLGAAEGQAARAPANGQKRSAAPSNDAGRENGGPPKTKKPRVSQAVAGSHSAPAQSAIDGDDADDSEGVV
ncbi:hypothetical protein AAE478_009789 [Parahypoxylon ruwenzoriense]